MKAVHISLSFALLRIAHAAFAPQSLAMIDALTPQCARKCNTPSISGLTCNATSVQELADCLCADAVARRKMFLCYDDSCDFMDAFVATLPSRSFCASYPVPCRSREIKSTAIALLAITIPFVLARAWARIMIVKALWWDDYTLGLASAFLFSNIAMNIPMSDRGVGKHAWDVDPNNAIFLTKMYYTTLITYTLIQNITKISILLCFLRIFPQRWFRIAVFGTLCFVATRGIIYLGLTGLRCLPVESTWDRSMKGKCLSINKIAYSSAALSILEDIWILILPMRLLKSLNVKQGKKVALIATFSIGGLNRACVTSIVRLTYMGSFGHKTDPTWDNIDGSIWSLIENSVAVICACLPGMYPLLSRFLPRFFMTSPSKEPYVTPDVGIRKMEGQGISAEQSNSRGDTPPTKTRDIYGMQEGDLEETRQSVDSFNFVRRESQRVIRMNTMASLRSEDGERPVAEKGRVGGF